VSGWHACALRMQLEVRIVNRSGPRAWASSNGEGLGWRRPRWAGRGGTWVARNTSVAVMQYMRRCVDMRLLAASCARSSGAVDGSEERSARLIGGAHAIRYPAARRGLIAAAEDTDAEVRR
jgi:hypothetical protein